jgi:hypothetical protein
MGTEDIPRPIREFISRNISSVEQIELLRLFRSAPEQAITAEQAGRRLQTSTHSARVRLEALRRARLVSLSGDAYRYAADPAAERAVADVERYYTTHRLRVISLIYRRDDPL